MIGKGDCAGGWLGGGAGRRGVHLMRANSVNQLNFSGSFFDPLLFSKGGISVWLCLSYRIVRPNGVCLKAHIIYKLLRVARRINRIYQSVRLLRGAHKIAAIF